jgi:hypothetical protein
VATVLAFSGIFIIENKKLKRHPYTLFALELLAISSSLFFIKTFKILHHFGIDYESTLMMYLDDKDYKILSFFCA